MSNYTLGLDMGVASLGWACISIEDKTIDSGVRIFPAGIDNFGTGKDTHLNQKRREKRCARRRGARKSKRKKLIRSILSDVGWIPKDQDALQDWESSDVYELRHRAITEKITLPELARVILHLNQRRGFLSLRKRDTAGVEGAAKKELEGMCGEIEQLENEISQSGYLTLGNYLYHLFQQDGISVRLRSRHIRRQMLYDEFSLIWERQEQYHAELNDLLRYGSHGKQDNPVSVTRPVKRNKQESILEQFGLENLMFFQRSVYWPVDSIGHCELEESELRAPIADLRFQEFRMLSELNNLRILDQSVVPKPRERELSPDERKVALSYLSTVQKPSLKALKKKIAKLSQSPEVDQIYFNLEADGRDNIGGLPSKLKLIKALGQKSWEALSERERNQIVESLTLPDFASKNVIQATDDETKELLKQLKILTDDQIDRLLEVSFPSGYCNLSIKALENLLPHMRLGRLFQGRKGDDENSARAIAGYPRRDEESHKTFDTLPRIECLTNPKDTTFYDKHFPQVNNPLVLRAIHEMRKVVNGVVRKHGKPSRIHLEMARDLKMSAKQRDDHAKKNNKHKNEREMAVAELEKYRVVPTRDAVLLFRLWEQQNRMCIYSGNTIGIGQLLNGEVDIDHIYPRRANDDSYMNKVVCFSSENRDKGDRLPTEWLASNSQKMEGVVQRAQSLPYPKRKRLLAEELPEDFAARDAVDTAYMTRVARHYLTLIVDEPHHVFCTKGKYTAFLRRQWQLNDLLRDDLLDLKNRDDHRHHALDAMIIALCDRSMIQTISKNLTFENSWKVVKTEAGEERRVYRLKPTINEFSLPWPSIRLSVTKSLNDIWVSHRPDRKISGPFHEETNYGATSEPGVLVRRKRLEDMTLKEVEKIRDKAVRDCVQGYCDQQNRLFKEDFGRRIPDEVLEVFDGKNSIGESDVKIVEDRRLRKALADKLAKKNPLQDAALGKIRMESGIPIRKVRLLIPNKAAVILRVKQPKEMVIPGNTHHLTIFSLGDGKHHFVPVTLLEAARRKREGEPIVDRRPPAQFPHAEFMMYLCSGDSLMAEIAGKTELFIFKGVHAIDFTGKFVAHTDGTKGHRDPNIDRKKAQYAIDLDNFKSGRTQDVPVKPVESLQFTCKPNTFEKNFPKARKVDVLPSGEIRNSN